MKRRKSFFILTLLTAFIFVLITTSIQVSFADEKSEEIEALYRAAKKEGEVVVSVIAIKADKLLKEFSKKYPGIKTVLIPRSAGKTTAKFRIETAAGRLPEFDVASVTGTTAPNINPDEAASADWAKLGVRSSMILSAGTPFDQKFLYWYDMIYIPSYNTKLVKPAQLPNDWYSLLDKKWEGKIGIDPRGHGIRGRAYITDEKECLEYARKIATLKPIYAKRSGSQLTKAVAAGQVHIAFDDSLDDILVMQKQGAPVDWIKSIQKIAADHKWMWTPTKAAHPNAAKLFMSWAISDEGAAVYEKLSNRGVLTKENNSKLSGVLKESGIKVYSEDNFDILKRRGRLSKDAARIFGTYK